MSRDHPSRDVSYNKQMPFFDDFCCKEKSLCIFTLSSWQFLPPNLAFLGLWSQVHYDAGSTTRKVMLLGLSATIPNEEIHELPLRVANDLFFCRVSWRVHLSHHISHTKPPGAGFNLLKQYVSSHWSNFPWITGQQENNLETTNNLQYVACKLVHNLRWTLKKWLLGNHQPPAVAVSIGTFWSDLAYSLAAAS